MRERHGHGRRGGRWAASRWAGVRGCRQPTHALALPHSPHHHPMLNAQVPVPALRSRGPAQAEAPPAGALRGVGSLLLPWQGGCRGGMAEGQAGTAPCTTWNRCASRTPGNGNCRGVHHAPVPAAAPHPPSCRLAALVSRPKTCGTAAAGPRLSWTAAPAWRAAWWWTPQGTAASWWSTTSPSTLVGAGVLGAPGERLRRGWCSRAAAETWSGGAVWPRKCRLAAPLLWLPLTHISTPAPSPHRLPGRVRHCGGGGEPPL